jgi:transcriptional regulator
MWTRLPLETQQEVWRLDSQGHSSREIARMVGRSRHGVANVLARAAAQRPVLKVWAPSPGHLSMDER